MDDLFSFDLPEGLIAQEPAVPRDHARLLVYDRSTKTITDDFFYNLAKYLHPQTTIVANNTKVNHCRYLFDSGKTEIFVIEAVNDKTVQALVRPGKKFKLGARVILDEGIDADVKSIDENGIRTLDFNISRDDERLIAASHVPLPPYIKQNDKLADEYQTIYAKNPGSLAAPTAGLHFTPSLQSAVSKSFNWLEVTLDVGLGTFAPLKEDNFVSGRLHSEHYRVSRKVYDNIMKAQHITAVGTTSLRAIETIATTNELDANTDIFITPGYKFKRTDSLITNFHLPSTSLLLLVEAFIGSRVEIEKVYAHAISNKYRFYSFGDAMLIK